MAKRGQLNGGLAALPPTPATRAGKFATPTPCGAVESGAAAEHGADGTELQMGLLMDAQVGMDGYLLPAGQGKGAVLEEIVLP